MPYTEIRDVLIMFRKLVSVEPLTEATHDSGMTLAESYGFSSHDSLLAIVFCEGLNFLFAQFLRIEPASDQKSHCVGAHSCSP